MNTSVTAYAPGGVGNVGPGLDILGLALAGAGDTVRAEWSNIPGVQILDPGHPELPREPERHASGLAARAVLQRVKDHPERQRGIGLTVSKGLPLSGGQGGSAASAVAAAVAVNTLLGAPLSDGSLVAACLDAEETVSGRHADNIVTSLLGGIVLIRCLDPLDTIKLPVPEELWVVVVRPDQRVRTADARAVLPADIPRAVAMHQAAQVGALVAALASSDYGLLGRAIDDQIAEPARAGLLPGFREAKAAALKAGALGCSISGSGPSVFALVQGRELGVLVGKAMEQAYHSCRLTSNTRVVRIDEKGARLVRDGKDMAR
ncbi:MAG TPA: homoserine kinase [Gemmatimonadales bacterium]